jgi:hypothetical protein
MPELVQPGREANHSPSSSAEVDAWSFTYIPALLCRAWCFVKCRDCFIVTLVHLRIDFLMSVKLTRSQTPIRSCQ